jgi:hypothetical protein
MYLALKFGKTNALSPRMAATESGVLPCVSAQLSCVSSSCVRGRILRIVSVMPTRDGVRSFA